MEMRASQVIKGALGGGAKKRLGEKRKARRRDEKRRERHLQIHIGGEVWKLGCHTYLAAAAVKQVLNVADLTCLDTKVIVTFDPFCRLHHRFSSTHHYDSFKVKKVPCCSLAPEQKLILSR